MWRSKPVVRFGYGKTREKEMELLYYGDFVPLSFGLFLLLHKKIGTYNYALPNFIIFARRF